MKCRETMQLLQGAIGIATASILVLTACSGGGGAEQPAPTAAPTYMIGGTVTGMAGSGLVLQNNGSNDLAIAANGAFTFVNPVASGSTFSITVKTQPTNPIQTCTVTSGAATVGQGAVTNIVVDCQIPAPGTIPALAGTWVVTENISGNCPNQANYDQYQIVVTQTGANLTVLADGNSFSGSITSGTVRWTGSYPLDGGTATITAMALTVSNNSNTLTGTASWTWASPTGSVTCSGTTQVTVQRVVSVDTSPPTTPTNLIVNGATVSQLQLSWSAATDNEGVTGYRIYRGTPFLRSVTATNTTDTGLAASTQYCYRVTAVDAAGNESAKSVQQCATTLAPTDVTPPTAPTNLSVSASSPNAIALAWNAATDNVAVTSYKIYRGASFLKSATATSSTDSGLTATTQYCYQVSATDAAGNESAKSAQMCATTPTPTDTVAPAAPGNVVASATSATQVNLSWNAATDNVGVTAYKVYRGATFIKSATALSTVDSGLSASTQYCYQITALDAAGNESAKSTQRCTVTLSAAPALTGPTNSTGSITLTWSYQWSGLSSNQDGYQLQESTISAVTGFTQIFNSSSQGVADHQSPKSYAVTRSAGTYYYRVRAVLAGVAGGWSSVVATTVSAPATMSLTAYPSADNTLIYSTVNSAAANTAYPNGDIAVGCNWADGFYVDDWACASMALAFNIQSQIAGKTIVSAKLRLYPYILPADWDTSYVAAAFVSPWSTSSITWTDQPNYYISGQVSRDPPTTTVVPVEFDVKTIVQNWASGTWANNGILIRDSTLIFPNYTAYRATSFYSSTVYSSVNTRPHLYVEYQ